MNHFEHFLAPVLATASRSPPLPPRNPRRGGAEILQALLGAPVIAGLLGFLLAWWFYIRSPETPKKLAASLSGPYKLLIGKYFVDELYAAVIVRPLVWISDKVLWHVVDEGAIDGAVNGVATVSARNRRPPAPRQHPATCAATPRGSFWASLVFTSLLLWMVG